MKPHLTATSFEALARERVAEFAPETDLDILGATFDFVRVSNQLVNDLETNVHRPLGWSWAGFRIMFTVLVTGPLEPGQIARLAGVTRASISAPCSTRWSATDSSPGCANRVTDAWSRSSSRIAGAMP